MSNKSNKGSERSKHADTIIRNHVIWSMGAGLIPVLIADIFAVSALQLDMIRQMARIYDVDFQETQGKAIVTSLTGSTLARITAGSVIKLIPGVGSVLGGVTVSIFAGASTYALGEVFKKHFESGGTILDFDPDRLRKYYTEKFEKGKKVAQELKKQKEKEDKEEKAKANAPAEPVATPDDVPQSKAAKEQLIVEENENDGGELDVLARLRELGSLKEKGIISEEEFNLLKKRLIDEF
ncbi:MAG: DUF697 domain-containing protein [Bacteroidota bacterium]